VEWEPDYPLIQEFWPEQTPEGWQEAREKGFKYCGIIEHDQLQAIAAVWPYSEAAWEIATVYMRLEAHQRGYAKALISLVTAEILRSGKRATYSTATDNEAMHRAAESVCFQRVM
jgi:predicted GNAT family acetyltransferase